MKQAIRIGLILTVVCALLIASGSGTALANECMSVIGEVGTQCSCGGTVSCSYP